MKNEFTLISAFCLAMLLSTFSSGQSNWVKYAGNPVMIGGPGNDDIIAIGQPTALIEDDTIKMWYAGVAPDMKARIFYAWSTDGSTWVKYPFPVIDVGNAGEWDSGWLDTPGIVKDNDGYKMYYYGDSAWQFAAISSSVGMATSPDGEQWTKCNANPVFSKGMSGEWDGHWVESPTVLFDSVLNEYKMWYNGVDTFTWKVQIGFATSTDGVQWTKHSQNPVLSTGNWGEYDDIWLGTPTVLKRGQLYEMWYSGTSTTSYNALTERFDTVSICYATSHDGISWTKFAGNPLFDTFTQPYDSLIDTGGPWAPTVVYNQGSNTYLMWYETFAGFSLATSPGTSFDITDAYPAKIDVTVYPNPIQTSAIIQTSRCLQNGSMLIINASGQIAFQMKNINTNEIILKRQGMKSGLYFLKITDELNTFSTKVIFE